MTARRGVALATASLLLTACGADVVQCGACPPPFRLELVRPVASGGRAEVCVAELRCRTVPVDGPTVALPVLGVDVPELDGRRVEVVLHRGQRSWRASSRFSAVDEGGSVCGCSRASARLDPVPVRR